MQRVCGSGILVTQRQGTAADVMKIARVVFYKRIKKAGIPCLFITTVHDSICIDCESKYKQQIVNLFHQTFDDLILNIKRMFGYDWAVPLDCECKGGMNMKDVTKIQRSE